MVNRVLLKDTFREIKHTFSRFLSIFFIVLLGVSFFAGIKATCPDMKLTADEYFDDRSLMDIHVVSTMGLTILDVGALRGIPGVESVYYTYNMDLTANFYNWDYVIRVFALEDSGSSRYTGINGVYLLEGRMPDAPNECLAEYGHDIFPDLPIGTKIKLKSGTDREAAEDLRNTEFTVVGKIATPYYITAGRGMSGIGGGSVNSFIMVPRENFKLDVYTDVFLTVKNAKEQMCFSNGYKDTVKRVKAAIEDISGEREQLRYDYIMTRAMEKLNEGRDDLAEGEQKQRIELGKARRELKDAGRKIEDGEKEIAESEAKLNKEVRKAKKALRAGYAALAEGEKEYNKQYALFMKVKAQAETEIAAAEAQIAELEAALELLRYRLANDPTLTDVQKAELNAEILAGEEQIAAAKAELEAKKQELFLAEQQLKEARKQLDKGKRQLDKGKAKLAREEKKAREKISDARIELAKAKLDYFAGQNEHIDAKRKTDKDLADARVDIAKAEKDINDLKKPEWYVLNRDENNPGYSDYGEAADRMDAIAGIFPVFFILVTALVCLTTMTRMVDEQRTYIGTLKALGFSKAAIAGKYFIYAALASAAGSVAGVFLGFWVFPSVIGLAYGIMYTVPPMQTQFYVSYAVISIIFAVFTTTVSAWAACYKVLKDTPAALMRPKAPPPGKRIFLERMRFIWRRLSFSKKITFRNLFRYKRRLAMTIIGIAGCMALVIAAFGLRDSISTIGQKQFIELEHRDMIIALENEENSAENVIRIIKNDQRIMEYMPAKEQVVSVSKNNSEVDAGLFIPESAGKFISYKTLRNRVTGKEIELTNEGVVISEKLSSLLSANAGDTITIEDGDHCKGNAMVTGVTEQYAGHSVYITPAFYTNIMGKRPVFNEIITINTGNGAEFENAISTGLMEEDSVSAVGFYRYVKEDFDKSIQSLYYVVLVLILSAGALAVVVLYNLTNINIMERLREIATIKVLGFYNMEVSAYVFWENSILTLLGAALGAILGIYLHKVVVAAAETESLMFGREIFFVSFIWAVLVTAFFMGLVNFAMYFRLKKINMVESLKSVE